MINKSNNKFKEIDKNSIESIADYKKFIGDNKAFCLRGSKIISDEKKEGIAGKVDFVYNALKEQFVNGWVDLSNDVVSKCFEDAVKTNLSLAYIRQGNDNVIVAVDEEYNILSINCNGLSINCRSLHSNSQTIIAVLSDIVGFEQKELNLEEFTKIYLSENSQQQGVDAVIYNRNDKHIESNKLYKTYCYDEQNGVKAKFSLTQENFDVLPQSDDLQYAKSNGYSFEDEIIYSQVDKQENGKVIVDNKEGISYVKDVFKDDLRYVEYCHYLNMPIEQISVAEDSGQVQ